MNLGARIRREWRFVQGLRRTLGQVRGIAPDSTQLVCDDFEDAVDNWRDRIAIEFEGRKATYAEIDAIANRFANWAREQNIPRGATVGLFLPNRLEYLPAWIGLTKVGVAAALINNHLTGSALSHCLEAGRVSHVITDEETAAALDDVLASMGRTLHHWTFARTKPQHRDLSKALKGVSSLRPKREAARLDLKAAFTALYIYTSGTTGLPKAAKIAHTRAQLYMRGFAGATGATPDDRIYVTLPLYHATGGLCGMGAALMTGATVVLKRRFSASQFWADIDAHRCTMFVYIGELCRYLVNQKPAESDGRHGIRLAFGNGLGGQVWDEMRARFNKIEVLEFYGSTEGNVSLFNFDGKPGAIGRIPGYLKKRFPIELVEFDIASEAPVRGADGLCRRVRVGDVGECLGKVGNTPQSDYSGYADRRASERKLLKDVFEKGDVWFRTGDLMRQDRQGYFYFVDRIGDTFRWKGENVSTTEVGNCLSEITGVDEATVYGVQIPGAEGRAGMAALVVTPEFDLEQLARKVRLELPVYAQPAFVRLLTSIETTGTFKYRKIDLVEAGFDPQKVSDPLYVRSDDGSYQAMTPQVFATIASGDGRL
jgi:fatty-acyl-CoA synthase